MFFGGISLTRFLDLSPRAAGQPRLSMATMAIFSLPLVITRALAYKSPFLTVAGLGIPTPPETASNGVGVNIRLAHPTINSCAPQKEVKHKIRQSAQNLVLNVKPIIFLFIFIVKKKLLQANFLLF